MTCEKCYQPTLDSEPLCAAHSGPELARLCIQRAVGDLTGDFLRDATGEPISPIFDNLMDLYTWAHARGWVERNPVSLTTSYVRVAGHHALKAARTSSAIEGITKPFDGPAMAEVAAKDYPPAVFPGA